MVLHAEVEAARDPELLWEGAQHEGGEHERAEVVSHVAPDIHAIDGSHLLRVLLLQAPDRGVERDVRGRRGVIGRRRDDVDVQRRRHPR